MDISAQKGCQWSDHALQGTLVAQGFTQTYRINYDESFTPVSKFASTHVVLAPAATHNWEVHQVDIKNAYLNVELTEKVYMAQPPGFVKARHKGKVCRLYKALYSLKQGSRCWYLCICEAFSKFGYTCCQVEQCVFYKGKKCGVIILVIVVDDLTSASNCSSLLLGCKLDLQSKFKISNMGEIHWLLGVEIKRD